MNRQAPDRIAGDKDCPPGHCGPAQPDQAATLARKRSTDERSCAACCDRSFAVASTMSAERLVFSVASAVPAMLRATLAVPVAAWPMLRVISLAAAFCSCTAAEIAAGERSVMTMMGVVGPALLSRRSVAPC